MKHWHQYSRSLRKLQKFLSETQTLLPPAGPARCSLQQLRRSLQDLQVRRAEPGLDFNYIQGNDGNYHEQMDVSSD